MVVSRYASMISAVSVDENGNGSWLRAELSTDRGDAAFDNLQVHPQ
ncbi:MULTISPECIES: hypothetical protein [unclassified Synechococcus]|nr:MULTISPECIES: hypothetical protein [unclassified Synechococcus]